MSERLETCFICDKPTGRAGAGEDSLYIGNIGPFDEECWEIIKTYFLSQLREEVEGLVRYDLEYEHGTRETPGAGYFIGRADTGELLVRDEVLALIEKAGGE